MGVTTDTAEGTAEQAGLDGEEATETVLRFVNTRADGAGHTEQFGSAAELAVWARQHELLDEPDVVSDSDAVAARELRDALVSVLLAHAGDPELDAAVLDEAETYLRHAAARYPSQVILSRSGATSAPAVGGVPGVLAGVLASAAVLAHRGEWAQLKACCNPPCHGAFFDRTRNHSGRYCSSACGSQVSMRAVRRRRREAAAEEPRALGL